MPALSNCPNCGAPLRPSDAVAVDCPYCGCRVLLDPKPAPANHAIASAASASLRPALIGLAAVVVIALLGSAAAFSLRRAAAPSAPAAPPVRGPAAPPDARPRVPLSRLAAIDVGLSADAAKTAMPRDFPEAEPDMHRIEYSFELEHPAFQRAVAVWEWGCNCLSHVHVQFKDYPTRQRAPASFVPCIDKRFGPSSKAQPPFSYDWDRGGTLPEIGLDQQIRIDLRAGGGQPAWAEVVAALDTCGKELAGQPR